MCLACFLLECETCAREGNPHHYHFVHVYLIGNSHKLITNYSIAINGTMYIVNNERRTMHELSGTKHCQDLVNRGFEKQDER